MIIIMTHINMTILWYRQQNIKHDQLFWSERSACAALGVAAETQCPLFLALFFFLLSSFFLSSFWVTYFSPGRGCRMVMTWVENFPIKVLAISDNSEHFFSRIKSFFFCELEPHAKFHDPRTIPSGRKVRVGERKKERKRNNAVNSGHYVRTAALLQRIRAAHAHRSDKNTFISGKEWISKHS